MVLALAIILALFVPWPWNLIVLVLGIVGEVGEIAYGRRIAKRWRPRTGAESMVGLEAEVASPCRPRGQVRILGELWEAMCEGGAEAGDLVRVTDVDGLRLVVERTESRMA